MGIAGDKEVCKNKINKVVPVIISADFQAANDISSDFVLSIDVDIRGKINRIDINFVGFLLFINKHTDICHVTSK
jgi:hypothetical protein